MYQSEQFNTRYGQVTWQPTDDSDIEGGNGDPCTSSAWDQTYSRIMGTVSITNGNSVPAFVSLESNQLTLLVSVHQSNGFASSPSYNILDAVFGPDGNTWWVEQAQGSNTRVVLHEGAKVQSIKFPSDVDVTSGVQIQLGAGGWALQGIANNNDLTPVWITSNQKVTTVDPMRQASHGITAQRLMRLLPSTRYTVSYGLYSVDHSSIAFLAAPPEQSEQLFTVPASGGNPKMLMTLDKVNGEIVYFGPILPGS